MKITRQVFMMLMGRRYMSRIVSGLNVHLRQSVYLAKLHMISYHLTIIESGMLRVDFS